MFRLTPTTQLSNASFCMSLNFWGLPISRAVESFFHFSSWFFRSPFFLVKTSVDDCAESGN